MHGGPWLHFKMATTTCDKEKGAKLATCLEIVPVFLRIPNIVMPVEDLGSLWSATFSWSCCCTFTLSFNHLWTFLLRISRTYLRNTAVSRPTATYIKTSGILEVSMKTWILCTVVLIVMLCWLSIVRHSLLVMPLLIKLSVTKCRCKSGFEQQEHPL